MPETHIPRLHRAPPGLPASCGPNTHEVLHLYDTVVTYSEEVASLANTVQTIITACPPETMEKIAAFIAAQELREARKDKLYSAIVEKGLTTALIALCGFVLLAAWEEVKRKIIGG